MNKKNLLPLLEGSRIVLKKHEEGLASTMFSYVEKDRERLGQFLPWVPFTKTVEDELNYIKHTHKCWDEKTLFDYGIFRKEDNVYMGNVGLHSISWEDCRCEVGYWILGDFEGQGYMSEALRVLEAHVFDLGFHRIEVRCSSINQRSAGVPIACGYIYDGVLKENAVEQEKFRHTSIFSKLVQHYKKPNIQEMTEKDITSVIAVAKKLPQFFTSKGIEFMSADFHSQKGFVYRDDDKVLGFITYFSNQGIAEIGWMGVLPEFQKNKIGTGLLNHLKEELKNNNCSALVVKTLDESVDYKPYEKTRAFYLKNNFKKSHVIQHPDNPECEAELVLKMDLK
ncbi:MAG: GNAT family N-acetyltransferase [Bdellovibrionaceae bacterium]|nr:GNAT family N-acetyltransferase [Pseudobdellovibrionaceae bacterium]